MKFVTNQGDVYKNKINLGCIYSKDFDYNFKKLIDEFNNNNNNNNNVYKNSVLCFFSYYVIDSGYKFRERSIVNQYELLNLLSNKSIEGYKIPGPSKVIATSSPLNIYIGDVDNIENLIKLLKDKHWDIGELIEREYQRSNGLGIYCESGYNEETLDFFESLDSDVFVDVINL